MVCMNTEGSKIVLCLSTEKTSYGAYEDHVSTVHMHVVHVMRGESILMYKHIHMSCPRTFFLAHIFVVYVNIGGIVLMYEHINMNPHKM